MIIDPVKNFAKVVVSGGYNNTATSIALVSGDGAKLPDPATEGAFNLVWWNSTDYPDPADDPYKEIVRCTAKSGDTLTITRAQEGTSAQNHNLSGKTYKMVLALTKKVMDDIKFTQINNQTGTSYTLTLSDAGKLILLNNSSAITLTVPSNSSVPFPIGTQIDIVQAGTGKVSINPATGVNINSQSGNRSIAAQWVGVSLIKIDTDTWLLLGNLIA